MLSLLRSLKSALLLLFPLGFLFLGLEPLGFGIIVIVDILLGSVRVPRFIIVLVVIIIEIVLLLLRPSLTPTLLQDLLYPFTGFCELSRDAVIFIGVFDSLSDLVRCSHLALDALFELLCILFLDGFVSDLPDSLFVILEILFEIELLVLVVCELR